MTPLRAATVAAIGLGTILATLGSVRAEPAKDVQAASPWEEVHASRARLVAGTAAGGPRRAGLEIVMSDGWKTYWRMPGDSGVPPTFDWSGSTNAANVKVLYPAPMRIPEAGGEAIGYKHAVLFPIEVTPQDAAKPVALKLALEFGICRDICVPATVTLGLVLPPGAKAAAGKDAVAAAIERVPRRHAARRPADPQLLKVSIGDGEPGARLTVQAAFGAGKGGDVFVEAPDGLYVPMLRKEAPAANGTVRFAADLSPDLARDLKGKTLTLTLVSDTGASEAQWTFP